MRIQNHDSPRQYFDTENIYSTFYSCMDIKFVFCTVKNRCIVGCLHLPTPPSLRTQLNYHHFSWMEFFFHLLFIKVQMCLVLDSSVGLLFSLLICIWLHHLHLIMQVISFFYMMMMTVVAVMVLIVPHQFNKLKLFLKLNILLSALNINPIIIF